MRLGDSSKAAHGPPAEHQRKKKERKQRNETNPTPSACVSIVSSFAADLSLRLSPLHAQPASSLLFYAASHMYILCCSLSAHFPPSRTWLPSPFYLLFHTKLSVSSHHLLAARAPVPSFSNVYMSPHRLVPLRLVLTILLCRHRLSHNNTQKPPPRLAARIMHHNSAPPTTTASLPCEGDGEGGCWRELLYNA